MTRHVSEEWCAEYWRTFQVVESAGTSVVGVEIDAAARWGPMYPLVFEMHGRLNGLHRT
jgi:hypothetical protein